MLKSRSPSPIVDEHGAMEKFTKAMFTELIAALARSLKDLDMSLVDIAALHLVENKGVLRIGEVAELLTLSMPVASRVAEGLVKKGLLKRRESKTDRRVKLLCLSSKGQALIDQTSRERVEVGTRTAIDFGGPMAQAIQTAFFKGDV